MGNTHSYKYCSVPRANVCVMITEARKVIYFFGVCGVLVALKTSGFDTRNMLGNIVANVPNTSSDIPCKRKITISACLSYFFKSRRITLITPDLLSARETGDSSARLHPKTPFRSWNLSRTWRLTRLASCTRRPSYPIYWCRWIIFSSNYLKIRLSYLRDWLPLTFRGRVERVLSVSSHRCNTPSSKCFSVPE